VEEIEQHARDGEGKKNSQAADARYRFGMHLALHGNIHRAQPDTQRSYRGR
jgi:hypothetical protein